MTLTLTNCVETEEAFEINENFERIVIYAKVKTVAIINRQIVTTLVHPLSMDLTKKSIQNNLLIIGDYCFPKEEIEEITHNLDEIVDFFVNGKPGEKVIGNGEIKSSLITIIKNQ
ncbi:MAG: hypothetical protein HWQ38_09695 [Nostoc sp. NMS7]|uniref:hypothetical protein n=1 Tax=Nostoc sp. NMS7 TaxID=2815391 RepID=UPI0025F2D7A5|nr:hypothetical protein [Nostoc sp. NMS7]MBN3946742.1 hypothetical protein [Nostoc sp. NMS7]